MSALEGLRVIEVSGQLTAIGGRLLAELGAEVIVVEPPEGSPQRRRPPFAQDIAAPNRSLRWWGDNAGKRSVTVDLGLQDGQRTLAALFRTADVVIEGGEQLNGENLSYEQCLRRDEALIWVSVTPFGRTSARAGDSATDLTLLAGGGPIWNCGYDDHTIPPIRGGGDQATNVAGLYCAIGTLVALAHRDQTGQGQLVEVNANAACNVTSEQATYNWLLIQEVCTRQTGRHAFYTETAQVQVRCADGQYATTGVLPRKPAQFGDLHAWLAELSLLDELPEAIFLELAAARTAPVDIAMIGVDDETTAILSAAREAITLIAGRLPAKEFFLASQRRGFPAGAVMSSDEAFEDDHAVARGFQVLVRHPELEASFRYPGTPYIFSATPTVAPTRPPLLGEHNDLLEGLS